MPRIISLLLIWLLAGAAWAQEQDVKSQDVKPLTADDCAKISRLPNGTFVIKGTVKVGPTQFSDDAIAKGAAVLNGMDPHEIIERSGSKNKP